MFFRCLQNRVSFRVVDRRFRYRAFERFVSGDRLGLFADGTVSGRRLFYSVWYFRLAGYPFEIKLLRELWFGCDCETFASGNRY